MIRSLDFIEIRFNNFHIFGTGGRSSNSSARMAAAGGSDGGVTEETQRAEREHFESVIRAFLWYRDHGMESIKKAEVPLCA